MKCKRCGDETPRLTIDQRYCPPCQRDVDERIAKDAERHAVKGAAGWRFVAKELALSESPL